MNQDTANSGNAARPDGTQPADGGAGPEGDQPTEGQAEQGATRSANGGAEDMRDRIEAVLKTVYDPEIPVNIFDLGLVYEIRLEGNGNVKIRMTLTAPACPVAGDIVRDVQMKVEEIPGIMDCHVQLTFDPPWTREMMTEEAKLELGFL